MLRRLIVGARRQDWFAVTLELLVVVLGIFIGMQVTNWNEDRKLGRQAQEYRESLASDLAADEDTMRAHADYFRVVESYGRVALEFLERPVPVTDAQEAARLITAFMVASSVWEYRQPRPTYEDMKSTGNLPLLGDTALRVQLVNYYTGVDSAAVQWDVVPGFRAHVRSIIPAEAQRRVMGACEQVGAGETLGLVMNPDCRPDLADWDSVAVLREIVESPGIKRDLTLWMSQLRLKIQLFALEADIAEEMRARLLGQPPN
jgi:hypothetical protein